MENRILKKYVERHASQNVLMRGKRLFAWQYVKVDKLDFERAKATFKVRSESFRFREYDVTIAGFDGDPKTTCTCDYDQGGLCKHRVASLLEIDRQLTEHKRSYAHFNAADFTVSLSNLGDNLLSSECSEPDWERAQQLAHHKKVKTLAAKGDHASFVVEMPDQAYEVKFKRLSQKQIQTSCTCADDQNPLCVHKVAAFLQLRERFGPHAFDEMQDWTKEKNALLAEYGYSITDEIDKKFAFRIEDGKLHLTVLDKALHKLNAYQDWRTLNDTLFYATNDYDIPELAKGGALKRTREAALLIYLVTLDKDPHALPGLLLTPHKCKLSPKTGKLTYIRDIAGFAGEPDWVSDETDIELIKLARAVSRDGINKFVRGEEIGYRADNWSSNGQLLRERFQGDGYLRTQEYVGEHLAALTELLPQKKVFLNFQQALSPTHDDLLPFVLSPDPVRLSLQLREENDLLTLHLHATVGEQTLPARKLKTVAYWLIHHGSQYHKLATLADANLVDYFQERGAVKVRSENFSGFLQDFVVPLASRYPLSLSLNRPVETVALSPEVRLYVKEAGQFLVFTPRFAYDHLEHTRELPADGATQWLDERDGTVYRLERDVAAEADALAFVAQLHPELTRSRQTHAFYLPFEEVLKNGWFFSVFEHIRERGIAVFGFNNLSNIRYNPNRPVVQMRTSSGIDWFDLEISVTFGEQKVSLASLRKAVLNKQNYVQLGDGTLGMLPEEWLQKYAALLRLSTVKDDHLELSKKHFSVIDGLYDELDNEDVQREITEKKNKLLNFKEIAQVPLPPNIRATLRDYQTQGYQWLHFLDEFGWGGCLADDMGLGKTLQVLAFLLDQKTRHPRATSLVVVPTTLIFNWNAEVEKFCPDLRVYTHRGIDRRKGLDLFGDYDVVLTTYGTVRSDVEVLAAYPFHYIILDESQAIKNPNSQISKAVKLLRAKNRLVMTGTPIENNTFDLYSQMDFLNPGLLGGQDFFKTEYATPIDKFRDADKAQELRKMVYPFMLKRTKEEVAKDLPDKTETVLYCEMEPDQRRVYDTFKEKYRTEILQKIETEGLNKSGFLILEGLLKLRQICDSPALLNEAEEYPNDSAKLTELIREISENAGHHKILIFSQFLKMLDLIRTELEALGINYEYLDGQTEDRADRVNSFQQNDDIRVFLMSLKAGGVGINLTEADYVYLVDPWWNPAVEQQAIDRTHRIGQTKKIFAYRMICKDSIEEKIQALQAKKKLIADDLISTETGFMKKLTRQDIEDLFS